MNLNPSQSAGQMLMAGFEGTRLMPETRTLIEEYHLGGLILFTRNFENPEQLHTLIQELQDCAMNSPAGLPLLISVDQEGGKVARLGTPFTCYPEAGCLGHAESEDLAYKFGRAMGKELSSVGINMDFAPVLDVNTNPDNPIIGNRAFSKDPAQAGNLGKAFCKGLREMGVIPVGKHFPGHGDTTQDSHLTLPYVDRPEETLDKEELLPFKAAIADGLEAMMTAHVVYNALDPDRPATFSPEIMDTLLRQKLGFQGVLFSDDLEMKAVSESWSLDAMVQMGITSTLDIFLVCHDREKIRGLHRSLIQQVTKGTISEKSIQLSVDRILKLKQRITALPDAPPDPESWRVEHGKLAEEMKGHLPA